MSGTKPAANLLDNISGLLYVGLSLDAYLASALGSTFACFSQLVVHVSLHRWLHFCLLLASMCFQDTRCSACSLKVQSFSLFLLFKRIAGSMTEDSFHDRHVHFRSIRSDVSEGRLHLIMQSNVFGHLMSQLFPFLIGFFLFANSCRILPPRPISLYFCYIAFHYFFGSNR
ncbi:hypothetical protein J3E72DRAFT_6234 [Bipolaris maydis]|uniref:uncharacterized protein n=1 Tax=Cochliobolus heterostrophus TaxID=5016 RepID=UPI0024DC9A83|nr:hypothetical protein J3E73DRAFT_384321 [Bipolaris maydis]KAJ6195331.1 hypothetical protein J3E72DRAFT_6234 [Bipolaris maydis]KAJ6268831.1 hypothetical protein PSV08DRAFT_363622 [Bipolaris maydis]KAJ6279641.1 hypothetical protein J3E71DRAFT_5076 [Bipolaris maydis]